MKVTLEGYRKIQQYKELGLIEPLEREAFLFYKMISCFLIYSNDLYKTIYQKICPINKTNAFTFCSLKM